MVVNYEKYRYKLEGAKVTSSFISEAREKP